MGFKKGVELTINTVIIIALGVLVLVLTAVWLVNIFKPINEASVDSALMEGCKQYGLNGGEPESIMVGDIDRNGQPDSLLYACKLSEKKMDLETPRCKEICSKRFPGLIKAPETP